MDALFWSMEEFPVHRLYVVDALFWSMEKFPVHRLYVVRQLVEAWLANRSAMLLIWESRYMSEQVHLMVLWCRAIKQ
jgi:hypothetical protein